MGSQPATVSTVTGAAGQPSAMRTLRRLYIYSVAAATLVIAAIGAFNLLGLGLDTLLTALTGEGWIQGGHEWERERLSFSVPFLIIAAPIWFLHWRMAQRALHGSDAERRSMIRAAYFSILLLASLMIVPALVSVIDLTVQGLLGGNLLNTERESLVNSLAGVLVIGALWGFHIVAYNRDVRTETRADRGALLPQVSLYIASAVGGLVLLFGISDLIRLAVDALAGADGPRGWWWRPLATGVALCGTGGLVWAVHWLYTGRLLATSGWWGKSAQGSGIRRGYLIAIAFISGVMVLFNLASGIDGIIRLALDVGGRDDQTRLSAIAGPILATAPFIAFWVLHRRWLLDAPGGMSVAMLPVTAQRLFGYVMAFLGLLLASAGTAMMLGQLVELVMGQSHWRTEIGWPGGLALSGGALWVWRWRVTRLRFARDPVAEQISTIRRAYLFVVFGGAVVALVVGLVLTIYQVLQELLGVSELTRLASDISLPLGITLATIGVALYHGVLLRRDMAVRETVKREDAAARTRRELVLTGPPDGNLEQMIDTLRRQLPEGYGIST